MITIDRDIPPPSIIRYKSLYPWEDMTIGDSFFAKGKTAGNLKASAKRWCKNKKKKMEFTARREGEGARIWRIK